METKPTDNTQSQNQASDIEEPGFWDDIEYGNISAPVLVQAMWGVILRFCFRFYCRLKKRGGFRRIYKKYPRLIIISNHTSHLDAGVIYASIPFRYWKNLHILVARDYWYSSWYLRLFAKYCLRAIPVDRKSTKSSVGSVKHCLDLLQKSKRIWMVMFPEGTRSRDGTLQPFKKGVSMFSNKTSTPVLFLYIKGNQKLWPTKNNLPRPGKITLYVGPILEHGQADNISEKYRSWVNTIK